MTERDDANRQAFEDAQATCPEGWMVCGVLLKNGEPHYFHAPAESTDDSLRDLAFFHREGRHMNNYERQVMAEAERLHA
jgi:hypothetical protein